MGTTLCAAPSKSHAFSTKYHACIAMPTWPRCAPPILFWSWPLYNLFLRLCLTWIFFVDPHWWVPLCMQRPSKAMPFQQIIMHALQCLHGLDTYASPILFSPWPPYNLFPRLCFLRRFSFMGTTLCAAPSIICHFNKLSCIPYCNAHMIYMCTYFVLTSINSCFVHVQQRVTCPTSNCGTSLFRQELVNNVSYKIDRAFYNFA